MPRKMGAKGNYEWQTPEVAFLPSLVGRLGIVQITKIMTNRLRERTGDPEAERSQVAVQVRINQIGLQSKDVVGGITTAEAAREIGSLAIINQMLHKKQIPAVRVGRIWVIPHAAWKAWKAKRVFPPKGYVLLSSIREARAIRSDQLSEFARMGYIPTAMRCKPYGTKGPSTQFGTWYVDKKVANKLVADRRAGRPMPWHGKPMADNLRATYKLWKNRQHPTTCPTCAQIWGKKGAPKSCADYAKRYPVLAHGAKRHLTREWTPGLTISEVAKLAGVSQGSVRRAMDNGMLVFVTEGKRRYVSRTDATRWKARKCPTGDSEKSCISLDTARKLYLFTLPELRRFVASKFLQSQVGTTGAMRGITYVSRHQCAKLREQIGFTEEQAARRIGVTVGRLRKLLDGVDWPGAKGIPLVTVQAAIKRLKSRQGYTIKEAALKLSQSVQWIQAHIADGTIKVNQAKWDRRRVYITEPMLARLNKAKLPPVKVRQLGEDWLRLSDAVHEAGVTATTVIRWAEAGELKRRQSEIGWRYHREAVRARSRAYWQTVRFHRATPPDWPLKEQEMMKKAA